MSSIDDKLAAALRETLGDRVTVEVDRLSAVVCHVSPGELVDVATTLRDHEEFGFEQLIDLCGVDRLGYGDDEWNVEDGTATGFSRGAMREADRACDGPRFLVVMHLLSLSTNRRVRVQVACADDEAPRVPSVMGVWRAADWFEREAFDLYGILFEGHPDLRRILTDYGFVGHPFRKDFPLSGEVEVRYDPEKGRVIYQPVSIRPRVNVPRVIRPEDNRYRAELRDGETGDGDA